ncbi:hypothetical protein EVAR_61215_1 [Eumeta japonica]|uniref:Gustatory receptor n=1 Tax=Eumeta variegata TaxID=151549 RepID=A0A4C1Z491_EUMVA|nr:hypothetical protein EVAR_61215_1 [Eumeta japonica]
MFKDLFKIPKELIEAFTLSSNLGQYPIFGYILSTFINSLMTLQVAIGWTKNAKIDDIYKDASLIYILVAVWNIKNFIMVIVYSVACEKFYSRIDDIKSNCALVLNLIPQKRASQKAIKNILRLCNVRFSKMRVCGLFIVDAALPLRLISLAATYCIVLLQFAFL